MFDNINTEGHLVSSTDIGKLNMFKYKQGYDFSFFVKDVLQRKNMLLIRVKFKDRKIDPVLTDFAFKSEEGELCFPLDISASTTFDLILFGRMDEEKDNTPEKPKFTEPVFSGFSN